MINESVFIQEKATDAECIKSLQVIIDRDDMNNGIKISIAVLSLPKALFLWTSTT